MDGDPAQPTALVAALHPATIVVTEERVSALEGDLEWTWLIDDLEAVHHCSVDAWTILVVPGVPDHGVALAPHDVTEFRRMLDGVCPGMAANGAEAPSHPSPPPQPVATPAPTTPLDAPPPPDPDPSSPGDSAPEPLEWVLPITEAVEIIEVDPPSAPSKRRPWARATARHAARTASGATARRTTALADLEARGISAWFGTHHVLDRVSLEMPAGQVTALIGPSGCGKSTFLRILNRMHELIPSASLAGEVLLAGQDIYDPSRKLTQARREIGMVFQKPNPFPAMSIYDNVVASLQLTGTKSSAGERDALVESCLRKAGLWNEVRDRLRQPGGGLSGGQQQRLCIARALAIRPRVLLMDEPCSALDPTSTRRIEETIHELGSEVTIVIVTHNMQQAARVSDRCAFFLAEQGTPGVIVEHGPTDAMFHSPRDPRTSDYVNGRFG
ncbi:MAG TPA: phosphate ABC transporter ATP-binding protein [Acidimicrobiales bacterium]|nr:phosphate ABC transporter ATP-binding protein [Acidimicrobiales bacterium]